MSSKPLMNRAEFPYATAYIAEIYDQIETYTADIALIRRLLGQRGPLRILEPFCGTGRLLLPLAADGHTMVGLDRAPAMLARARQKLDEQPTLAPRVTLLQQNVLQEAWSAGFDLVVLGSNCLYELATPEEQQHLVEQAWHSLLPGGHVFVDSDHMEGELAQSWQKQGPLASFPTGICDDGTRVATTSETVWNDNARRLARFRRVITTTSPDGSVIETVLEQQKHPVSGEEVATWLRESGFVIEQRYGDWLARPYRATTPRAIFWARKPR